VRADGTGVRRRLSVASALRRADKAQRITLAHGDVLVWGGSARLRFHGVLPVKQGRHELLGAQRINLTLRKAH